jgi:hypothetical protein
MIDHSDAELVGLRDMERTVRREMRAHAEQVPNPRDYSTWDAFYAAYDVHQAELARMERLAQGAVDAYRERFSKLREIALKMA